MLRDLLNTNPCNRALRPALRARVNADAQALCLSNVVLYESFYDADRASDPPRICREGDHVASRLARLPFNSKAALHTAKISADLARRSCVIGPYDLMIAGQARGRGLIVITPNLGEFCRVPGHRCKGWE